jgi:hypothetical protein
MLFFGTRSTSRVSQREHASLNTGYQKETETRKYRGHARNHQEVDLKNQ